jgi:hypothetical protein
MYRVTGPFFATSRFVQKTANQKTKNKKTNAERHEGTGYPKAFVRITEASC